MNLKTKTDEKGFMYSSIVWEPEHNRYKEENFRQNSSSNDFKDITYDYYDDNREKLIKKVVIQEYPTNSIYKEYDEVNGKFKEIKTMKEPVFNSREGKEIQRREETYANFVVDSMESPFQVLEKAVQVFDILNGKNNLIEENGHFSDKKLYNKKFKYDKDNNLLQMDLVQYSDRTQECNGQFRYTYYQNGNLKSELDYAVTMDKPGNKLTEYNEDGTTARITEDFAMQDDGNGISYNQKITEYKNEKPVKIQKFNFLENRVVQTLVLNEKTNQWEKVSSPQVDDSFNIEDVVAKALENSK